jgi:DNA polymerase alpha-associated DNA helicase A
VLNDIRYRRREAKVVTNVVRGAGVVLATCHSAGARQLNNMDFDVAIIDEATQAVEAVCWVPILKAKKLILAGDPEQLPPTILSKDKKGAKKGAKKERATDKNPDKKSDQAEEDEDDEAAGDGTEPKKPEDKIAKLSLNTTCLRPPQTLETTLFHRLERLYGSGIKRVLKVQYRYVHTSPAKLTLYQHERAHRRLPLCDTVRERAHIRLLGGQAHPHGPADDHRPRQRGC